MNIGVDRDIDINKCIDIDTHTGIGIETEKDIKI